MKRTLTVIALTAVASLANASGFDEHYAAYTGDLTGDGLTDIYLRHTPELVFVSVGDILTPIVLDHPEGLE